MALERIDVSFTSGDDEIAAWHYAPSEAATEPGPCIVMAHGFSLTRHDGLAAYAERFAGVGVRVLVFDHRYLGD